MTNIVNDNKKGISPIPVSVVDVMERFGYSIDEGLEKGLIEAQDVVNPAYAVKRRALARMVHMYLKNIVQESDCDIWQPAQCLRDLFDCRTCVNHVAQVYVKGIMPGINQDLFGMEEDATTEDLELAWKRIQDPAARDFSYLHSGCEVMTDNRLTRITCAEAIRMREERSVRLVDVRNREEYEEYHLPGAELYPVQDILENPLVVGGNPAEPLLVGCRSGRRSETAAHRLLEVGYTRLYYFGLEN